MEKKYDIRILSLKLRGRLENEILGPLVFLETASGFENYSFEIADKVFKDFKKVNDEIWEELRQKICSTTEGRRIDN